MVDTVDVVRLFCDGRISLHDVRALVLSMGHSEESFVTAVDVLSAEAGSSMRVGAYQKGEFHAEIFLTAMT